MIFERSVAIDTETMGLCPHRDRLCLVQLSSGDGIAHLVQFDKDGYDKAHNLKKLLLDESVLKIFHFARFDLAILKKHLNVACASVYCTKIAAKLIRTYSDKHGLKDLCKEYLGIDLSKQEQTSDWGAENLTPEQLRYAASDVFHLHLLKFKLDALLKRENRMNLAQACFDFLPHRADLDLMTNEDYDIFKH
ncbi:MAG TPA: ribonuclease H-like domain-containing protein [Alphaproteobacteria bacterium]|nr:ribonuclease H-like domain-containing protein [Alphaproteobacteria bacterium]